MKRPEDEEILGYRLGDDLTICSECIADEELAGSMAYEILTASDVDDADEYLYCDRCASKLIAL